MERGRLVNRLKQRARALKGEIYALYLAIRSPDVPWYAKLVGALVVGYVLSPLDLIPDFIPVLGLLDDIILVPAGIALVIRLIPAPVLQRCREQAARELEGRRLVSRRAAAVVIVLWLLLLALIAWIIFKLIR